MTAIGKTVCYSSQEESSWLDKRQRELGENMGRKALLWFSGEGMGKAGQADLGLAGFSGFSGVGAISSCVLSGPGVSTAGKWCL